MYIHVINQINSELITTRGGEEVLCSLRILDIGVRPPSRDIPKSLK